MRIKSIEDLLEIKKNILNKRKNEENMIIIKVSLATCGIAAGGKHIKEYIIKKMNDEGIKNYIIKDVGCMGYCYLEPTIEVMLPGYQPVVFGRLDKEKIDEIFEKYINRHEIVDGIVPINYNTI